MSVLSERLKELRGPQSQAQMAKPLGIVYQQWAKYERGESAPGSELLAKICRVHACSADWLLGLDRAPSAVTVNGSGNTFATGAHSRVSGGHDCTTCPFKTLALEFQKAALKLPRSKK